MLITGGAGFIGSNLAKAIYKFAKKVVIFDLFGSQNTLGHFKNLTNITNKTGGGGEFFLDFEIIPGCITKDLDKIKCLDFDFLYHFAAISDTTQIDQKRMLEVNYEAFSALLKIALDKGAKIIYASSAGVYGNTQAPNKVGFNEMPENIYGFSKLLMDNKVRALLKEDPSLPIIGLRYFNVYGEGEYYKGKTASMIFQLTNQIKQHKSIKLFEFGEQKRDFVYIKDVTNANILAAASKKGGVYNIGSGESSSFNDIVNLLKKIFDFEVQYIKNPYDFFQQHTKADILQTKQDLGYVPRYSLEAGINEYLNEHLKNI